MYHSFYFGVTASLEHFFFTFLNVIEIFVCFQIWYEWNKIEKIKLCMQFSLIRDISDARLSSCLPLVRCECSEIWKFAAQWRAFWISTTSMQREMLVRITISLTHSPCCLTVGVRTSIIMTFVSSQWMCLYFSPYFLFYFENPFSRILLDTFYGCMSQHWISSVSIFSSFLCVYYLYYGEKKVHTFHMWLCVNKCRRSIFIDTISQSLWVNLYRLLFPLQFSHSQMFLCRYLTHWPLDWLLYFHTTIARSLSSTFRILTSIYNDIECMFVVWFIVSTNELERRTRPKNAYNFFFKWFRFIAIFSPLCLQIITCAKYLYLHGD